MPAVSLAFSLRQLFALYPPFSLFPCFPVFLRWGRSVGPCNLSLFPVPIEIQKVRPAAHALSLLPDGYLDIANPLTVVAPIVDPGSGYRTINEWNPLVFLGEVAR